MLGIYEITIRKISFDTGIDKVTIEKALKGFETVSKVLYIENNIILPNFIKHQSYNINMKKSAINTYNGLSNGVKFYNLEFIQLPPERKPESADIQLINKGFVNLCEAFGILRKIEVEVEVEVEREVEVKVENKKDTKNDFKIPTIEEIAEYCKEKKITIDAEYFFNHYESNGWMVGKAKMKKWKATVANWGRRDSSGNAKPTISNNQFRWKHISGLNPDTIHKGTEKRYNEEIHQYGASNIILVEHGN